MYNAIPITGSAQMKSEAGVCKGLSVTILIMNGQTAQSMYKAE